MRAVMLLVGLLLAGAGVVDGDNSCFKRCKRSRGLVNLYGCGLTDADLPGVATCFDEAGRASIKTIVLSANKMTTLPAGLFDGLEGTRVMLLNAGKLSRLPSGLFDGLDNLEVLGLMDNELTTLLFDDLGSIENLYFLGNPNLQCVPANVATRVRTDNIPFVQCECTPAEVVMCGKGLDCVPGEIGYTCEKASHNLGAEQRLSGDRATGMV